MSLLKRLKNLFLDQSLPTEEIIDGDDPKARYLIKKKFEGVSCEIIDHTDSTYLVSTAARMSVGMDPIEDYDKRISHLSRIIKMGHESILEHTNIIMMLHISKSAMNTKWLAELLASCKYLDVKTTEYNDTTHILIGGSIRGYKHIIKFTKDALRNHYILKIIESLYSSAEAVFFEDMIDAGVMDRDKFAVLDNPKATDMIFNPYVDESVESAVKLDPICRTKIETPTATILESVQPRYSDIMNYVSQYGFTIEDVIDIARVSVIIHDISRPISMQVIRHRNPVTQESQRYVDYSRKLFINPLKFHDNDEMLNKKFKLSLFGTNFELSGQELGNRLCKIYHQLIEQGMKKQDARSYLPSNVCTRLIMTFTYRNLLHFLNLRMDKAAQAEIRNLSNDLLKAFNEYDKGFLDIYDMENVEIPYYTIEDKMRGLTDAEVDEILSEEEI